MSKIDQIKEKYLTDAEQMASKARFGYFSLLPSHTAAISDFQRDKQHRQSDGKVHTEPRNIYSGVTSTGSLKKNYFSYVPSAFTGSPFEDPGKHDRKQELSSSKKWQGKETYKPAKLSSTIISAAYEYLSPYDPKQQAKSHRNAQGKVITQSSNVLTSVTSKIQFQRVKEFRYVGCPPEKKEEKQHERKEGDKKGQNKHQDPFKTGSPKIQLFYSHSQTYFDSDLKRKEEKGEEAIKIAHEAPFKPSCASSGKDFTPFVYTQQGIGKTEVRLEKKENKSHQAPFKLTKIETNSKPTPSIAYSKTNVLRGIR